MNISKGDRVHIEGEVINIERDGKSGEITELYVKFNGDDYTGAGCWVVGQSVVKVIDAPIKAGDKVRFHTLVDNAVYTVIAVRGEQLWVEWTENGKTALVTSHYYMRIKE